MNEPKFAEVWCSQCGRSFGPGNHGFSHCADHAPAPPTPPQAPSADTPKPSADYVYLGDGLYASFDGYQLRLYTSDGIRETNEVFLEPSTLAELLHYVEHLKKQGARL